ncbi:aminoglycoside phosphotransferase family protein [Kamptonema cortianum]|nr:aminoglycoside phosphotransferase family protein [Geitlerinema splendidum]MDK3158453.1 aminoglycoside phosphotransferase family protein [Kamptonema cortianum]
MTREDVGDLLAELGSRWKFEPIEELPEGYCSRVFADSTRVLKIPWRGEELSAIWANRALSEAGGPQIFEADEESGAVLMERLIPGTKLAETFTDDASKLQITAELVNRCRRLQTGEAIPIVGYLKLCHPLLPLLTRTTVKECFLHGDLHHENILLHEGRWVPIDPKGLVGDVAFEPSAFLRNPIGAIEHDPNLIEVTRTRVHSFARAINCPAWRIAAWATIDRISIANEYGRTTIDDKLFFCFKRILFEENPELADLL